MTSNGYQDESDEEWDFQASCAMFESTKPNKLLEEPGEEEERDIKADDTLFVVIEADTEEMIDFDKGREK